MTKEGGYYNAMTPNEYQLLALRTESRTSADPVPYTRLTEALMGLNGEAGEAIELLKKSLFQGHQLHMRDMAMELGDVCWYLALAADAIGFDLESVMQMNLEKLRARYPNGFDPERSVNRVE